MSRKIICPRCGKIVEVGHDCDNKYKDSRKRTQLNNTRWVHIRNNVRKRDLVCYLCWYNGIIKKARDTHHIVPREINDSDNMIYNEDNCIYLCEDCHHEVHRTKNSWKEYVDIFKKHIEEVKNGNY